MNAEHPARLTEIDPHGRDMNHLIYTASGRKFWPLQPRPEEVYIEDIARALSNQCRFTGHTREFYSVAQHSCLVSDFLRKEGRVMALWGLLHDASEAYLSDIARPVKYQMPEYRQIEARLMEAVATRYALPMPEPPEVKHADNVLLMTERRDLLPGAAEAGLWVDVEPLPEGIVPWSPDYARSAFLDRFYDLIVPPQFKLCGDGSCCVFVAGLAEAIADGTVHA